MNRVWVILSLVVAWSCGSKVNNCKIGNYQWMDKNLNVSTFRNGDSIHEVKSFDEWFKYLELRKPAWCYYDFDPQMGKKYGKIYNWYAVTDTRNLAPEGWRIPNEIEWRDLYNSTSIVDDEEAIEIAIRSKKGWIVEKEFTGSHNPNGKNTTGFNAVPGGYLNTSFQGASFSKADLTTGWWSKEKFYLPIIDNESDSILAMDSSYAYIFSSGKFTTKIGWEFNKNGYYVRCVKDNLK